MHGLPVVLVLGPRLTLEQGFPAIFSLYCSPRVLFPLKTVVNQQVPTDLISVGRGFESLGAYHINQGVRADLNINLNSCVYKGRRFVDASVCFIAALRLYQVHFNRH